jgi:DNA-binding GntR family transcriptional regulator
VVHNPQVSEFRDASAPAPLPPTRAEAVADELRRLIKSGELAPGTRLPQNGIAKRIGVSTTPVREAFTALAREGLIRQDSHRGALVFLPSLDELNENYEIRIALESLATRLAAGVLRESDLAELERVTNEMRATNDPHVYLGLNREFHARIYAAANRPKLAELIDRLRDAAAAYISLLEGEDNPEYAAQVQDEHERIVAALKARDAETAAQIMGAHLASSAEHIAGSVKRRAQAKDASA